MLKVHVTNTITLPAKLTADGLGLYLQKCQTILQKEDIILDLSQVKLADTAGVQFILIILYNAIKLNRDLSFTQDVSPEMLKTLRLGGFISQNVQDGTSLKTSLLSLMS